MQAEGRNWIGGGSPTIKEFFKSGLRISFNKKSSFWND